MTIQAQMNQAGILTALATYPATGQTLRVRILSSYERDRKVCEAAGCCNEQRLEVISLAPYLEEGEARICNACASDLDLANPATAT